MNNSKVFITGINGFVGQNLRPYLEAQNYNVKGISREKSPLALTYDIFLKEKQAYGAMVHLAGKAHDLKRTFDDKEYYDVNFELTKLLYKQFLNSDAEKFIYISSVKAVADEVQHVLTEEVFPNPITAYGKSKRLSEEYILANIPASKKVYILRPCMIHGPGNKGNLNLLFGLVRKGFPWPLGAFINQRSFCSIENFCFVVAQLLDQDTIPSGVYNIADDESLSTNELITLISNTQKKRPRILMISKKLIVSIAKIGGIFCLPLNAERLQKLTESYVVSNHKIIKALNKPLPVAVKEGLIKTFESFK